MQLAAGYLPAFALFYIYLKTKTGVWGRGCLGKRPSPNFYLLLLFLDWLLTLLLYPNLPLAFKSGNVIGAFRY